MTHTGVHTQNTTYTWLQAVIAKNLVNNKHNYNRFLSINKINYVAWSNGEDYCKLYKMIMLKMDNTADM